MKTETIATYETKTGLVAFEVVKTTSASGKESFRYNGKYGAGCGALADITKSILIAMSTRRGMKLVSGVDLFLL